LPVLTGWNLDQLYLMGGLGFLLRIFFVVFGVSGALAGFT